MYLFVDFEHRVFLRPYLPDRIEAQGIKNWISMTQVNRQIREDTKDFAPRQKTAISTNDLTSKVLGGESPIFVSFDALLSPLHHA
jgi:hypothetical protein